MSGESERKLVILGAAGVGKTAIALTFVKGKFAGNQQPTIGAAFLTKNVVLKNGQQLRLHIWDTAGQERFASIAPMYYRGADAAIIVYDLTDEASYQRANHWVDELERNVASDTFKLLVGNKLDMIEEGTERAIPQETAKEYATKKDMTYLECSAKAGINLNVIFEDLAERLAVKQKDSSNDNPTILGTGPTPKKKGCCG